MKISLLYIFLLSSILYAKTNFRWESFLLVNSNIKDATIYDMVLDSAENRWFATNKGVFIFSLSESWENITVSNSQNGLLSDTVYCLEVDAFGSIWMGTDQGLNHFSHGIWERYTKENSFGNLPNNKILSLTIHKDQIKWIGTLEGFASLDGAVWQSYPKSKIVNKMNYVKIQAIAVGKNEHIWLGTEFGLVEFDGFSYIIWNIQNTQNRLPDSYITALELDNEGRLWIGTQKGVAAYYQNKWMKLEEKEYLKRYVNQIKSDLKRGVWIASRGGLIHFLNVKQSFFWNASNTKYGILGFRVLSVLEESIGNLWVATQKGLSRRISITSR